MHIGLGPEPRLNAIEVRWPSGTVEILERLDAGRVHVVKENVGVIAELARQP
jgi:hypothetical protein